MLNTIIVAIDCSAKTEPVISALDLLQTNSQTEIILLHVLPTLEPDSNQELDLPQQSRESLYQTAEEQLQDCQAQLRGSKIEIVTGDTAQEIVRLANIYRADLIVLGTRGLQGVDRIIAGSVSGQVVSDAPCSVLVVKND